MNLNLDFTNSYYKKSFEEHTGFHFGSIINITQQVQKFALDNKIDGNVAVSAYQTGGDPSKLAGILTKNANGTFYALGCSL